MIYSDYRVQFACHELIDFINYLVSMLGKGKSRKNAVAESFLKTIKTKRLYNTKVQSFDMPYYAVFSYIEGQYNTLKFHSVLKRLSPMQCV